MLPRNIIGDPWNFWTVSVSTCASLLSPLEVLGKLIAIFDWILIDLIFRSDIVASYL
jgi:hypothetical protein